MIIVCVVVIFAFIVLVLCNIFTNKIMKQKINVAMELLNDQELMYSFFLDNDLGKRIKQWLASNDVYTIAVAFERKAGRLVLKKIKELNLDVAYCISTNAVGEIEQLDVYHPLCEIPTVDLVIVLSDFDSTMKMLNQSNESIWKMTITELLKAMGEK